MAIADENVFILLENSSYGFNNRGGLIYWEALLSVLILRKRKVPEPNAMEDQIPPQQPLFSCH